MPFLLINILISLVAGAIASFALAQSGSAAGFFLSLFIISPLCFAGIIASRMILPPSLAAAAPKKASSSSKKPQGKAKSERREPSRGRDNGKDGAKDGNKKEGGKRRQEKKPAKNNDKAAKREPKAEREPKQEPKAEAAPKSDAPLERGKVKWFNGNKGFGFLVRDNGEEVFVHFRSIQEAGDGRKHLRDDQDVEFRVVDSDRGPQAEDVRAL